MKESGLRNGAHGADKFGFKDVAAIHWNLPDTALVEHAVANREGALVHGGAFCAETGVHTGRSPKDKFVVVDAQTEKSVWWEKNGRLSGEKFQLLLDDFIAHAKGKALYAQDLYGGADPKYRIKARVYTELAWHSMFIRALLIRPDRAELAHYVPDFTILVPAVVQGRSETPRRAQRDDHRARLHQKDHPDRRQLLRRRDEEVGVHRAELLPAGRQRDADALLGQCRAGRRRGAVLRPFRHRQDDAVRRSQAHAHRRRRARLGPAGRVQFRGRLLRQVHQALRRGGAGNLRHHAPLRHRAGERGVRSAKRASAISTTSRRPRIRAPPIRSTLFRTPRAAGAPACRRTSYCSRRTRLA